MVRVIWNQRLDFPEKILETFLMIELETAKGLQIENMQILNNGLLDNLQYLETLLVAIALQKNVNESKVKLLIIKENFLHIFLH